jgi:hypothetical protein
MLIFPALPLPAQTDRTRAWGGGGTQYDSGAYQAMTPYSRPMMKYSVPYTNFNEIKQALIQTFVDSVQGPNRPFLIKDPYEFAVSSVLAVRSGVIGVTTCQLYDTRSFFVRADTTTVGSLFSTLSGYVRNGHEYNYDQDTGVLTVNSKASTDVWGVRSMEYFRKVAFVGDYRDTAALWNIWNATLNMNEII